MEFIDYPQSIFEENIPDEWRWERIRIWRNELLKNCDFRMVQDSPWDKIVWATYRQQLRDLPTTVNNPSQIIFPQPPEQ
jgi:hypothetical protein